jgi:hypothetical protein
MKSKTIPFQQHLYHKIEDIDKASEYAERLQTSIGAVVMYFSGMESDLNSALCQMFTDSTDSTGLIVLHKMNYSAKVDLFKRFSDDFHLAMGKTPDEYNQLVHNLREAGRLRSLVVHAEWDSTDEEGYTFVSMRINQRGMEQEYIQFSEESLDKILELITTTSEQLDHYWEARSELLRTYPDHE